MPGDSKSLSARKRGFSNMMMKLGEKLPVPNMLCHRISRFDEGDFSYYMQRVITRQVSLLDLSTEIANLSKIWMKFDSSVDSVMEISADDI